MFFYGHGFRLHLVYADLSASACLYDIGSDNCSVYCRIAEYCFVIVDNCENIVECDFLAGTCFELFDENDVALCNTVLFTAGNDYCMLHNIILSFKVSLLRRSSALFGPFQRGLKNIHEACLKVKTFFSLRSLLYRVL